MVAETFGLQSIAVGVSEENNNMDRIPNNTSLYMVVALFSILVWMNKAAVI